MKNQTGWLTLGILVSLAVGCIILDRTIFKRGTSKSRLTGTRQGTSQEAGRSRLTSSSQNKKANTNRLMSARPDSSQLVESKDHAGSRRLTNSSQLAGSKDHADAASQSSTNLTDAIPAQTKQNNEAEETHEEMKNHLEFVENLLELLLTKIDRIEQRMDLHEVVGHAPVQSEQKEEAPEEDRIREVLAGLERELTQPEPHQPSVPSHQSNVPSHQPNVPLIRIIAHKPIEDDSPVQLPDSPTFHLPASSVPSSADFFTRMPFIPAMLTNQQNEHVNQNEHINQNDANLNDDEYFTTTSFDTYENLSNYNRELTEGRVPSGKGIIKSSIVSFKDAQKLNEEIDRKGYTPETGKALEEIFGKSVKSEPVQFNPTGAGREEIMKMMMEIAKQAKGRETVHEPEPEQAREPVHEPEPVQAREPVHEPEPEQVSDTMQFNPASADPREIMKMMASIEKQLEKSESAPEPAQFNSGEVAKKGAMRITASIEKQTERNEPVHEQQPEPMHEQQPEPVSEQQPDSVLEPAPDSIPDSVPEQQGLPFYEATAKQDEKAGLIQKITRLEERIQQLEGERNTARAEEVFNKEPKREILTIRDIIGSQADVKSNNLAGNRKQARSGGKGNKSKIAKGKAPNGKSKTALLESMLRK